MNNEIIIVPTKRTYRHPNGSYGVIRNNTVQWFACREVFHAQFTSRMTALFFSLNKDKRTAVIDFMSKVENKIGVRDTVISRTNFPDVLHIKPGLFWRSQRMRFSLFTILLRAAVNHKTGDPVERAMLSQPYLANTYKAVKMFISGRSRYTGWGRGWVDVFIPYCGHLTGRRHQRKLETLLVPDWQVFPLHLLARFGRWINRLTHWSKKIKCARSS